MLSRYQLAATSADATHIVRITSDCPLIDAEVVDEVVTTLLTSDADYAANILPPRTFARGLDVEAFTFEALEKAHALDTSERTREHVTPYLYGNPDIFKLRAVSSEHDFSDWRWTVDTPADLNLIRKIYEQLSDPMAGWQAVLDLCKAHPEWMAINAHVEQKKI